MNRSILSTLKSSTAAKMLVLLVCLAISQVALAGQLLPQQGATQYGFQPQQLETLRMMDIATPGWMLDTKQGFGPAPTPDPGHENFPLDCDHWDSMFCEYSYPGEGCCCVAEILIANSYCPDICA